MDAVTLGPFFIPMERLLFVGTMLSVFLASFLLERRYRIIGAAGFWTVLIAGFTVGRLVHVLEYWSVYQSAPLEIFFVWQGGFHVPAGVIMAVLMAVIWSLTRKQPQAVTLVPVLFGAALWWGGGALLLNQSTPDAELPNLWVSELAGQGVNVQAVRGEPTVINLWATWCPPCRREMPVFERAQNDWPTVHFVYANQGENAALVREFLDDQGLSLQTLWLDGPSLLSQQFEARGLPMTLFFDAEGRLVDRHLGEVSSARLAQYLASLTEPL